jgi:hypothetical protein
MYVCMYVFCTCSFSTCKAGTTICACMCACMCMYFAHVSSACVRQEQLSVHVCIRIGYNYLCMYACACVHTCSHGTYTCTPVHVTSWKRVYSVLTWRHTYCWYACHRNGSVCAGKHFLCLFWVYGMHVFFVCNLRPTSMEKCACFETWAHSCADISGVARIDGG